MALNLLRSADGGVVACFEHTHPSSSRDLIGSPDGRRVPPARFIHNPGEKET